MTKRDDQVLELLADIAKQVDQLDSRLDSVDKTLVRQEANLGEHMRRTELAERSIQNLEIETKAEISKVRTEAAPTHKHVAYMNGAFKGLGVLAVITGIIASIVKIFSP